MKLKYKTMTEKYKTIMPVLISVCGIMLSVLARRAALITPERRITGIYIVMWSFVTGIATAHCFGIFLPNGKKLSDYKRIECMMILSVMLVFVALPRVADVNTPFISGIETSAEIGLLCFLAIVFVAVGDMKSARLLVYGVLICGVIGRVYSSPAYWDISTYSIKVFRPLFTSELLIPLLIISALPAEGGDCCAVLHVNRRAIGHIHRLSKRDTMLAKIVQIILCILSGLFTFLCQSDIKEIPFFLITLIISVCVISEIMGMRSYNGLMVAFPVFIKLIQDNCSDELILHSSYHNIYMILGIIALFGCIRGKRNVFLFAESSYSVVLMTELLSFSNTYMELGVEACSSGLTIYGAELLMSLTFILFGYSEEWSGSIIQDFTEWILMPEDGELDSG